MNHCTRVAQNSFGSNIKFIESFDPSLPHIYANKDLLIQIFLNLLKNACEAASNTDKIKIKTSFNSDKKISFSHEEIPSSLPLQIEIIDYGTGITKSLLPNIFDPFIAFLATSTNLTELDEFLLPITKNKSHFFAIFLTAICLFVVA